MEVCTDDRTQNVIEHSCARAGADLERLSASAGTGVQAFDDVMSWDSWQVGLLEILA